MKSLQDKIALVTGAASGIGRSIALAYAREGAKVVVSDLDQGKSEETLALVKEAGAEGLVAPADVSDPAACEAMVEQVIKAYGRLDIACNNAGVGGEQNPTADYSLDGWRRVIDINLSSIFYCMKYQIPAMLRGGGGAIVNMASILGMVGFAESPAYSAAKHGVLGLTKASAQEYATQGIRINSVGPGFIHTPMISHLEEADATRDFLVSLHPMGRLGRAEEVAELVLWLSTDKASFVTGAYYPVDGGYLSR